MVIEDYGRFLKKKGKSILSKRTRVEPLHHLDSGRYRHTQTIRNWHEKRIYVRQFQKVTGEVGAVAVIFDEGPGRTATPI